MSMSFEPAGGFPPIVRVTSTKPDEKTLESRGFATTSIVKIGQILNTKKTQPFISAFGPNTTEEEGVADLVITNMLHENPHEYRNVSYKEI